MIPSINLLPYRAAMRARQRAVFFSHLGLATALAAALSGAGYMGLQSMIASQASRNQMLTRAIGQLNKRVATVSDLRKTIAALEAREQAVENLQNSRNTAAQIVQTLTLETPNDVRLTEVGQKGEILSIHGVTDSQQRVADYLRSLSTPGSFLRKPELVRIKSDAPQGAAPSAGPQPLSFEIHVTVGPKKDAEGKDSKGSMGHHPYAH